MKDQDNNIHKLSPMLFQLGLVCSISLVLVAFDWKFYDNSNKVEPLAIQQDMDELLDVPPTEQMPPPPPKEVKQPTIIEVPDEEEIIEEIDLELDMEVQEEEIIDQIERTEKEIVLEEEATDEIFTIVEEPATYKEGDIALLKFITINLKYPEMARRMAVEGRVFVNFVVEKNGSITNIMILKGIGAGCDEEAMRIVSLLPSWNPARQRGRPVRSKVTIPLIFELN